ncbi:hypothetical protein G4B88_008648, partial [Cannabis sativa]
SIILLFLLNTNKGAWTIEEDDRLNAYIRSRNHGCWCSLPKVWQEFVGFVGLITSDLTSHMEISQKKKTILSSILLEIVPWLRTKMEEMRKFWCNWK